VVKWTKSIKRKLLQAKSANMHLRYALQPSR
jgi:hypothetical protein